jgi:hypothetical protein
MIRQEDVNWQFWRKCYCALDRELNYLLELKATVCNSQFSLRITLNETNDDHSRITKENIAIKYYALPEAKINLRHDWKTWTDKFYEDYFAAKDAGCMRHNGMVILK